MHSYTENISYGKETGRSSDRNIIESDYFKSNLGKIRRSGHVIKVKQPKT